MQAKKKSGKTVHKTQPKKKVQANSKNNNPPVNTLSKEIVSLVLLMLAVFFFIVVTKFRGLPEDREYIGIFGTYLLKGLETVFGDAALVFSFFLLAWSIHLAVIKEYWSSRMWGVSLIFMAVLIYFSLWLVPGGLEPLEAGLKGLGGGALGGGITYLMVGLVGRVGTIIFLILNMVVALVLVSNQPLTEIIRVCSGHSKKISQQIGDLLFYELEKKDDQNRDSIRNLEPVIIDHNGGNAEIAAGDTEVITRREDKTPQPSFTLALPRQDNLPVEKETPITLPKKDYKYQKPPLELLSDISSERTIDKKNIKESINILEDTFKSFGIGVKVNQVSCGPAVTRYELTPAPGVKVSRIISLTDDLQLNLAAPGIRMEAPIPGKSAVGIEVPNSKVLSVGLRSLLSSPAFKKMNSPLTFVLGEDISGSTVVSRLSDMPHLLIAGSTGSGKSVCLNCIIMSLLFNSLPDELKLVFIDPKMVELTVYNGIPHLYTPVVTDPKKAAVVLRWMVTEMEKRYKAFAEQGVRDINRYNQAAEEKLPYIVIVIDELADLMMVAPVEVEDSICRLAQMARAAGMHLIVATQRPSVDVVTGVIKANIPSRIAFAVSSQADSRTILDIGGAEKLLGKGDMLFFPVGASKPYRVQGAYVSDADIEKTVEFISRQGFEAEEALDISELEVSLEQSELEHEDDLFWDAVRVFVESRKASASLLQRRLRIGYARAARLVDMMEDRGIVSALDNNKRREILIDKEQLEKLIDNHNLL
ncbi:DNA translocase FtsK 4TM domain-containing protein [Syntrophomonas erecta]